MRRGFGDLLRRARSSRTGAATIRVAIAITGAAVIVTGIILLPLPGPGWLIIFAGIGIWAVEFAWASRLLRFAKDQVLRWERWYRAQRVPTRIVLGVLLAAGIAVIALFAARYTVGWDTLKPW